MKKFEAPTLQEAISKASLELDCSILDLEYNILQNSRGGFLGFFKKSAIIEAKNRNSTYKKPQKESYKTEQKPNKEISSDKKRNQKKKSNKPKENNTFNTSSNTDDLTKNTITQTPQESKTISPKPSFDKQKIDSLVDNFYTTSKDNEEDIKSTSIQKEKTTPISSKTLDEIKHGLTLLFSDNCFNITKIEVSEYSEDCVLINLDGEDAALLIGKEGYRYKALSYLLFNWINGKYNLSIRLEIAEFLKNQEERISIYTQNVIQRVEKNGYAQTKILDGVLIKIALEQLRAKFPNKYVGIKTSNDGKFIVINDFIKKHE